MKSSRHALLLLQVTTSCGGEEKLHQALSTSSKPRRETPRASDPSSCVVLLGKGFLQSNHPFLSRKKIHYRLRKGFPSVCWQVGVSTEHLELAAPSRTPRLEVLAKAGHVPLHTDLEVKKSKYQQHQKIPIIKPFKMVFDVKKLLCNINIFEWELG